jgi:uncharacterized protein (DUF169 family)
MIDYQLLEKQLSEDLRMTRRPVAITFLDTPPVGVRAFSGTAPSGCSFWRFAADGDIFYTVPADHYNCAIGAYTHNIPLPPERAGELTETLGLMASIGYVRMEEVPGIPRLPVTPGAVVYAPLGQTPVDPDVALFIGLPGQVMLLQEASMLAGVSAQLNVFGRPTCMALPAALALGVVASTGCVGNRVYTGIQESEMYVAVPGKDLARIAEAAHTIATANAALTDYHRGHVQKMAAV